jgi:hypothetical protein
MTPIALCSDDYAQNPGIDAGILELLACDRLTAVSCFSTQLEEHSGTCDTRAQGAGGYRFAFQFDGGLWPAAYA